MTRPAKITASHLARAALVYVRQSTPGQVRENLESQDLQYQLAHHAERLGWPAAQVRVIDDDLGKSGVSAGERRGFQDLVAAVALAQVGVILVTDVSRLARNCTDWYQLLDLAARCDTLIADAAGLYDPRQVDDRLLLGLKGTFAELHWHNLRSQLSTALFNKARRGELALRLPIGYDREPGGRVVLTADRQVQDAIRLVFALFRQLGSAHRILHYCQAHGLTLPHLAPDGLGGQVVEWTPADYTTIYQLLKRPIYAGAYAYGRTQSQRLPGAQKVAHRHQPMENWIVLQPDHHAGYISWDEYRTNQAQLAENRQRTPMTRAGPPRAGLALLQGIVYCARCGRPLHPRYRAKPIYVCEAHAQTRAQPRCQRFGVAHVDAAVSALLLQAVQPAQLELALAATQQAEAERQQLHRHWQERLARARYEATLARRRYEQVDPDNRLVAAELERRWEASLQEAQALEQTWMTVQAQAPVPLSAAEQARIRQLAHDLPALWQAPTTSCVDRKRLLRCLMQSVTLDSFTQVGYTRIQVLWHTGATSEVRVPRPRPGCRTPEAARRRIQELAQSMSDDQIAATLNAEGLPTAKGGAWNQARVRVVRSKWRIASQKPYPPRQILPRNQGCCSATEAAAQLRVSPGMICEWYRRGRLVGYQERKRTGVWVRLTAADLARYAGDAPLTPDLILEAQAPAALGLSPEEIRHQVQAGQLLTYRLWRNHVWRWYVQRPNANPQLSDH
jgi:DNA invertase Pin-like site-specific DNA recombinase/ribosomal protein L34E